MQDKTKISIFKYTWPGLLLLIFVIMTLLGIQSISQREEEVSFFTNSLTQTVKNQEMSFIEESYLFQLRALEIRLNNLYNSVIKISEDVNHICLNYKTFNSESFKNIKLGECDERKKTVLKFPFVIGETEVAELAIEFLPKNNTQYILSYLKVILLSFIISMFIYYVFTRQLSKHVIDPYIDKIMKHNEENAKFDMAKQVSHDIRSPLTVLSTVVDDLNDPDNIDEYTLMMIKGSTDRITEIANELLRTSKENSENPEQFNLSFFLEDIIIDKNLERNVNISLKNDLKYSKTFVTLPKNSLYRAVSNLLNNAIECQEDDIKVDVEVLQKKNKIELKIKDYGIGMNKELVNKALAGDFTTKETGNGLGLSSAKKFFEQNNSTFEICSKVGKGSTIRIILNCDLSPSWFVEDVILKRPNIVCIDNDSSFRQMYAKKFNNSNFNLQILTNLDDNLQIENKTNTHYFVDYDFGSEKTGAEIIVKYALQKYGTLVTSKFDDEKLQSFCLEHNVKILPKRLFKNIKVHHRF